MENSTSLPVALEKYGGIKSRLGAIIVRYEDAMLSTILALKVLLWESLSQKVGLFCLVCLLITSVPTPTNGLVLYSLFWKLFCVQTQTTSQYHYKSRKKMMGVHFFAVYNFWISCNDWKPPIIVDLIAVSSKKLFERDSTLLANDDGVQVEL